MAPPVSVWGCSEARGQAVEEFPGSFFKVCVSHTERAMRVPHVGAFHIEDALESLGLALL